MITRRTLSRRGLLIAAVGGMLATTAAGCVPGEPTDTVGEVDFDRPLAVPPLAESRTDAEGRRVFALTAQAGKSEFVSGKQTNTWGFNSPYLGPTLRARRGETVAVDVHNELAERTTVHWHGMHLPAAADGGPHQMVRSGDTWTPSWKVDQPATTLWYHPHPHEDTEEHVHNGLAGLFLIDDDQESALSLPREYGVDDIPVIVQDRRFDSSGQFSMGSSGPTGHLGDTLLVNGTLGPYLEVGHQRIRLRLLNASGARVYAFGFSDGRTFALVGTDGGLLAAPHHTDRIQLSPGERAEIVVELSPGERVVLRSYPQQLGTSGTMTRHTGGDDSFDVLQLRAADTLASSPALPEQLVDVPRLDAGDARESRYLELRGREINGRNMDMDRIDEVVTVDTTEVWEVANEHDRPHNFHIHDVQFQVLEADGDPPAAELSGWKDTVYIPPKTAMKLIMRFTDYTDTQMPYMYHCHLLYHEDRGMMGQFLVVKEGQQASGEIGGGHGHQH